MATRRPCGNVRNVRIRSQATVDAHASASANEEEVRVCDGARCSSALALQLGLCLLTGCVAPGRQRQVLTIGLAVFVEVRPHPKRLERVKGLHPRCRLRLHECVAGHAGVPCCWLACVAPTRVQRTRGPRGAALRLDSRGTVLPSPSDTEGRNFLL